MLNFTFRFEISTVHSHHWRRYPGRDHVITFWKMMMLFIISSFPNNSFHLILVINNLLLLLKDANNAVFSNNRSVFISSLLRHRNCSSRKTSSKCYQYWFLQFKFADSGPILLFSNHRPTKSAYYWEPIQTTLTVPIQPTNVISQKESISSTFKAACFACYKTTLTTAIFSAKSTFF